MEFNKPILFLIITFFLLKGLYLIFTIPPWEAPDEPGHVSYVIYLYKYKSFPSSTKPYIPTSISQSLRIERTLLTSIKNNKNLPVTLQLFNRHDKKLDPPVMANLASNPPLYYVYLLPFYIFSLLFSSYWSLILLRIASLILGALSLYLTYKISGELFHKSIILPLLVTFLLSLQPMFAFISSIVNKDIMISLAFLLFIYFSINELQTINKLKNNMVFLAILAALSPLIMPQLLILIPLYFLLLIYKKKGNFDLKYLILILTPSIIWFTYKIKSEGIKYLSYSVLNIKPYKTPIWLYPWEFIKGKQPTGIFMSFWGFFGWLDVSMPKLAYLLFLFAIILGLIGYVLNLGQVINYYKKNKKIIIYCLIALLIYVLSIFYYDLQVFILAHSFVIHGRYLAPVSPLLLIALVYGLKLYPVKIKYFAASVVIGIFLINQIIALTVINKHYYGSVFFPKVLLFDIYRI